MPQPYSLQSSLKAASLTPAIGARIVLDESFGKFMIQTSSIF
jgi:hypothetical protein